MQSTSASGFTQETAELKQVRRRIREYAKVGLRLFAQRIVIYSAAVALAGFYYDWTIAAIFYFLVMICEIFDAFVFRSIINLRVWGPAEVRRSLLQIFAGTIFSSAAISLFAISFALQQGTESGHFMPIFILISASIFATMNNHQFIKVLATRLAIYVAAILFIPIHDIWMTSAPISSELWLNFFTVIFVLGFLLELARSFIVGYSKLQQNIIKLEEEHERTKAAYIAKTQFISTVSHELRTPLTSIKGALALVNSGALGVLPEKTRVPIEIANRNTRRLADLVDDLLLLQRAEGGKLELALETLDFGELVLETIERFRPYAESAQVGIKIDVKMNEFWVRCDKKRVEQVVTNLLSNAAKFSKELGDISISMEKRKGYVRLLVADKGIGIPDGAQSKVFEEFGQLDSSDTRRFQGTGLGLNISKRITEAHNARIYYTSILGVGSTFYVEMLDAG